jgi:hypothetical protein
MFRRKEGKRKEKEKEKKLSDTKYVQINDDCEKKRTLIFSR